jgi:hypothetical protein
MEMEYKDSRGSQQTILFGNKVSQNPTKTGNISNLRKRIRPYDRRNEKKICCQFEYRDNNVLRNRLGRRFLRCGSVCLLYVLDDDRRQVISNPALFADTIPMNVHDEVFSHMAPFLELNSINRQSPENPYYQLYQRNPLEIISQGDYIKSFQQAFYRQSEVLRSLLIVYAFVGDMTRLGLVNIAQQFIGLGISRLLFQGDLSTLSDRQLIVLVSYMAPFHPEYYFNLVAGTLNDSDTSSLSNFVKEVRRFRSQYRIDGFQEPFIIHESVKEDHDSSSDDSIPPDIEN